MSASMSVAADFALLTESLTDPDADLVVDLETLAAHCASAVESYLGLSITVDLDSQKFHVVTPAAGGPADRVQASLHFPVPGPTGRLTAVAMTVFAGRPGALVDLGADLAYLFGLGPGLITLDRHLDGAAASARATPLADMSTRNQAIGVLIERGADPDSASAHLSSVAVTEDTTVTRAAAAVLESVGAGG